METIAAINPEDLKNYTAAEVAGLADLDKWAVRDEGVRRQEIAEKKIARLRKQIEAAQRELHEAATIINAAASAV